MSYRLGYPLAGLAVSLALGCSGGGDSGDCVSGPLCDGGGDTPEPVATVAVTAADSSVVVGASLQMSVSTLDAAGTVLNGRTVSWSSSDQTIASVGTNGSVTGESLGDATITATSEGRIGSAPVTVLTNVASVILTPDPAEVISTLNVQMTATAQAADASTLSGKTFTWSTGDASIATVDASGEVTGGTPGSTMISATSEGVSGVATVNVLVPPPIVVASVNPSTLVEGQAASITGLGFSTDPASNTVTVDGVVAVVTQATTTALNIVVPTFDCLPTRSVDVLVTVAGETSDPSQATASPESFLAMAVGDQVILGDPSGFCMQFDEAAGSERYVFGVQSVSEVASTLTPVRVSSTIPAAAPVAAPMAARLSDPIEPRRAVPQLRQVERWTQHAAAESAFIDRENRVLNPLLASGASRFPAGAPGGPAGIPGDVTEGTVLSVRFPGYDTNSCDDFLDLGVIVRKVGTRVIIVEDTLNPAGGFTASDFDALAADFDGTIYDVNVDFFGTPSDLDVNGRIVVVVSKEVNDVTSPPLAFVTHANLFPVTTCAASNEGEYYWTRAPDPAGTYAAGVYTLAEAQADNRLLLAHEFTHIIQGSRRMAAGGFFMPSFMAEGGATAAQEFVGFEFEGRSDGLNYAADVIYPSLGADPNFYYSFMSDLLVYFGFDFDGNSIAGAPEECTFIGSVDDNTAGPCDFAARLPYGPSWSLVRHAIDQYGAALGGSRAVHRALVDHSGTTGFAALETVFGETIGDIMATWAAMLYLDDRFVDPALDRFQFANWNLRNLEDVWGSAAARLTPRARGFADFQDDFNVRAASNAFFDLSGAGRSATAVRMRDQNGDPLPAFFQVWIVRVE